MNRTFHNVRDYQRALDQLARDAFPKAMAATTNVTAKAVHSKSERNIKQKLTLRNPYTMRSLKLSLAKVRRSGEAGYAQVGSVSPYLPIQETGGTVRARRRAIAIPTKAARIGGVKTGVVAMRYRMRRIGKVGKGGKFFFLPTRKPGLYTRKGKRLIMIRDISVHRYRLKPTHWHGDAVKQFGKRSLMEQIFIREAQKQLGMIK